MRRKNNRKRTKEKVQALVMTAENVMNQPEEKIAQRSPGEKGKTCYYCGKEGRLKRDCPQASNPPLAPGLVYKGPY